MAHQTFVEETDNGFRWECACRKHGRDVKSRSYAEDLGRTHERRYAPKKMTGPKTLRNLLSLES